MGMVLSKQARRVLVARAGAEMVMAPSSIGGMGMVMGTIASWVMEGYLAMCTRVKKMVVGVGVTGGTVSRIVDVGAIGGMGTVFGGTAPGMAMATGMSSAGLTGVSARLEMGWGLGLEMEMATNKV